MHIAKIKLIKLTLKALNFLKIAFVTKLLLKSIRPNIMLLIKKSLGLDKDSIFSTLF